MHLALLASVGAGASLALAAELAFLALRGSPARTSAAVPVIAVIVGAAGLFIAAALARNEAAVRLHANRVQLIGDPALDSLEDDVLLDTLAARLLDMLGADQVAVLLTSGATKAATAGREADPSGDVLEVVASAGLPDAAAAVVRATDYPAAAPTGVQSAPPPLPQGWRPTGTAATQPVTGDGATEGMVFAGWSGSRAVGPDDERLVALTAGRVWSVVHRRRLINAEHRARLSAEGARRQLALLAYGGTALASALDQHDREVAALAEVCVPAFADLCAIDLVNDRGRLEPAVHRAHPAAGLERPRSEAWRRLVERALPEGRTCFGFVGGPGTGDELADEFLAQLGACSVMVVPVQAGGLSMGTLTMATGASRRGFRSGDLAVAEDLAGRLAVAIQRVLLHQEVVASAEAQARAARRLRRLTEAAITLAGTAEPDRLLGAASSEARRVVQGAAAQVVHRAVGQPERRVTDGPAVGDVLAAVAEAATASGTRVARDGCLAAPLLDSHQVCRGALAVAPRPGTAFDGDDEAALVSLAHLVVLVLGRAELTAAVAVREARMQALVDASPLSILRLSPLGQVLEGNRAARQLFGWHGDASTGPLPESLAGDLLELVMLAAQGEAIGDAEVQGAGPDGRPLDLSVAVAPVPDESGRIDAVMLVVADLSERRRVQRQLQQAQRLDAMGQVAGGVAHAFNNLLTVIVGYTEALIAATDDDDPALPMLESIERAGASAAALTNQLLGLAGRRAAQPVPIEPDRMVAALAPVVRRLVGVDVDVVLDTAPVGAVVVDPLELEQVILNLAINARDAMPDGGRLGLSVGLVEVSPLEAEVHGVQPGPYVQLSVSDTGTGMDDETLTRCFEPFFTRKDRGRGTGLGLAAVHAVTTEAGGAVTVSSELGQGTTFRVWLPCTEERPVAPPVVVAGGRASGAGRVLLVEDEEEIRLLARHALEDSGFTVVPAASAAAALTAYEEASAPFDVLVSDIVMPGMRGTELAERLRERQPDLAVLFVSGYSGVGPQAGEVINGVGVLRKPYRSHDLCSRVMRLADEARAAQGSNR